MADPMACAGGQALLYRNPQARRDPYTRPAGKRSASRSWMTLRPHQSRPAPIPDGGRACAEARLFNTV